MQAIPVVANGLGKSFGARTVLNDLSFSVAPGEVVGVLGKNGAGKTTLLELILGFTPANTGGVQVFGHESRGLPAEVKARIGFVPQQDELLDQLTVADQLRLIASFYPRWDDSLMASLCQKWQVDREARIKRMSVGERQKLSILTALGHRPDLLVLDEPVASLDPVARRLFLEELVDVAADGRRAVVFSSHIVSDIERLANRIWILKNGRLEWQGDLDSLKESIVRVHLHATTELPAALEIPNALSVRRERRHAVAVVRDWMPEFQEKLASDSGSSVEIEALALEDIFLELHR
jgi:ABC-2 type transport system ATP-binding protein